jgi:histone-lysine N-methyltransferase ASH1L
MMRGADDKAHMGIFAGDEGVMTGEELTYDYNFDNFGSSQQKCHCGSATCRGFLSKRLNAVEQRQKDKEELERQRKAAEEAMKNAEAVVQAKKEKSEKGPGWTGWLDLSKREVREQLKKEKEAREAEAKSSDRARRMAARNGEEVPPAPTPKVVESTAKTITEVKKPARRRHTSGETVKTQKSTIRKVPSAESSLSVQAGADRPSTTPKTKRPTSSRSATTTLLERALSVHSNDDDDDTPAGKNALTNGDIALKDVYDGPEPELDIIVTSSSKATKVKKHKLGNMLKGAASAVGIGRSNKAEASSSNNRTPGKLRQSTLSFSKLI